MTDIINRIEGAGEGSRELDLAIAKLNGAPADAAFLHGMDVAWSKCWGTRIKHYTDDVSDAMSLIPEGWLLHFLQDTEFDNPEERHWSVSLRPRQGKWDGTPEGSEVQTFAATPALALCAAALKSRTTAAGGGE